MPGRCFRVFPIISGHCCWVRATWRCRASTRCPTGVYLCAGIFLYAAFAFGFGPNDGWFNYVPYAARAFNGGPNIDFYALGMILLGISTTVGSINFVVTFLRLRAPGMSINRVPILVWGTLTAS